MQILQYLCVLSLLTAYHVVSTFDLSSLKCSVWDRPCLKKMLQILIPFGAFSIPEMGIQGLDPMRIPLIKVNQGGLKAEIENVIISGVAKTIVQKLRVDKYSKLGAITAIIPELTLNGTYRASGFLHTQPFNGKGDVYLRSSNLEIDIIVRYDVREDESGKKFADLNDYFYSFEVLDGIMVLFNNLYDGDHVQSAAVHNYIQKHWKQISAEFGRPLLDPMIERIFNANKYVLNTVSLNAFYTDW